MHSLGKVSLDNDTYTLRSLYHERVDFQHDEQFSQGKYYINSSFLLFEMIELNSIKRILSIRSLRKVHNCSRGWPSAWRMLVQPGDLIFVVPTTTLGVTPGYLVD